MRRVVSGTILAALVVAVFACAGTAAEPAGKKAKAGLLRHVVLFKFKEGTTPEQIKAIEQAFRGLPAKIPEIVAFEWGTDASMENKSEGFTHCFFVTFKDAKGRDAYLPHPAHKEFGKVVRPHADKVLVFDYVAKE
jgi:hypothetical protein